MNAIASNILGLFGRRKKPATTKKAPTKDSPLTQGAITPSSDENLLQNEQEFGVPLSGIDMTCDVVDVCQRLQIKQTYINPDKECPLEVTYRFDAGKWAALGFLGGFSAQVGGKTYKGIIKNKDEAQDTYDDAIAEGRTAAVVHQTQRHGAFQASLGNLPPGEECVVTITFLSQAQFDSTGKMVVTIPTCLFPDFVAKDNFAGCTVTVNVKLQGGFEAVECDDYPMKVQRQTAEGCTVTAKLPELPTTDFVLKVESTLDERNTSRGWIQTDEQGKAIAASVIVHPMNLFKNAWNHTPPRQVVFILDCSGSMGSSGRIEQSKDAMTVFLRSLPLGVHFNLIKFGSSIQMLNRDSIVYDDSGLSKASEFVKGMSANLGGTDMIPPLREAYSLATKFQQKQQGITDIFVLTDGFVDDPPSTMAVVKENADMGRLFAVGLGDNCSLYQVRTMAAIGGGLAEFSGDGDKALTLKVQRLLKQSNLPSLKDVTAEWECPGLCKAYVAQSTLYPVFMGSAIVQSILLHNVDLPSFEGKPVSTGDQPKPDTEQEHSDSGTVGTIQPQLRCKISCTGPGPDHIKYTHEVICDTHTTDEVVARLAANNIITSYLNHMSPHSSDQRDWQTKHNIDQGVMKANVIDLSLKYGVATEYTSFVCVADESGSQAVVGAMKQVNVTQQQQQQQHHLRRARQTHQTIGSAQDNSIMSLQKQMEAVKNTMSCNIENVLARGERLDCLVEKTDQLDQQAMSFKASASKLKSQQSVFSKVKNLFSNMLPSPPQQHGAVCDPANVSCYSAGSEYDDAPACASITSATMAPPAPLPPPPRSTTTTSNLPTLMQIASLQSATGYWKLTDEETLLGGTVGAASSRPADCSAEFWVTALVIALLQQYMSGHQEEWELLVEKAKAWMHSTTSPEKTAAVLTAARGVLTKRA